MDQLINELCERTGIDRATAQKIASYLQANATRIPELLGLGGADGGGIKGFAQQAANKFGGGIGR